MSRVAAVRKAISTSLDGAPHFHFRYEPFPKTINCTTLPVTAIIASDPNHPLHAPTMARLAAWDPEKLHWAVRCPTAMSRKRTVRTWATKRIREAFFAELRRAGYDRRGTQLQDLDKTISATIPAQLTGALSIVAHDSVVTAPIEDINHGCHNMLKKLIKAHV